MHRLAIKISDGSMRDTGDLPVIPPDHITTRKPLHAKNILRQLALEVGRTWLT